MAPDQAEVLFSDDFAVVVHVDEDESDSPEENETCVDVEEKVDIDQREQREEEKIPESKGRKNVEHQSIGDLRIVSDLLEDLGVDVLQKRYEKQSDLAFWDFLRGHVGSVGGEVVPGVVEIQFE